MDKFLIKKENITAIVTKDRLKEKFIEKKSEHDKSYWNAYFAGDGRWQWLGITALWVFNSFSGEKWVLIAAAVMLPISVGITVNKWQAYKRRELLISLHERRDFTGEMVDNFFQ